jgi:hypothetical protein
VSALFERKEQGGDLEDEVDSSSSAIVDFAREHPTNLVKVGAAQGSIRVAAGGKLAQYKEYVCNQNECLRCLKERNKEET